MAVEQSLEYLVISKVIERSMIIRRNIENENGCSEMATVVAQGMYQSLVGACREAYRVKQASVGIDQILVSISRRVPALEHSFEATRSRVNEHDESHFSEKYVLDDDVYSDIALEVEGALRQAHWEVFGVSPRKKKRVDLTWDESVRIEATRALVKADGCGEHWVGNRRFLEVLSVDHRKNIQRLFRRGDIDPSVFADTASLPWPPHDERPVAETARFLESWGVLVARDSSGLSEPKKRWMSRIMAFFAESSMVLISLELEAIRQTVRLGHSQVSPRHLLLAIIAFEDQVRAMQMRFSDRQTSELNAPVLSLFGVTTRTARRAASRTVEIEPTARAKRRRAWRTNPRNPLWGISAARMADNARYGDNRLGSGSLHLVRSVLQDTDSAGRELLDDLGVSPVEVLSEIDQRLTLR